MAQFGGYYKGEKKKPKRTFLEKKAQSLTSKQSFILPKVEIFKKGKNEA